MVHTEYLTPAASLRSLIRCYSFQYTEVPHGCWMQPLLATPEIRFRFFLEQAPVLVMGEKPGFIRLPESWTLSGPFTRFAGQLVWPEESNSFTVHFLGNGFYRLFGLPGSSITNRIIGKSSWKGACFTQLLQQLLCARNGHAAASAADLFLEDLLRKKLVNHTLDYVMKFCRGVIEGGCQLRVGQLAKEVFVSLRQAERSFTQQIGLSPKLYCRLVRFEKALRLKQQNAHFCWTEIAHMCGYYDQMHLIKDFRQFAGEKPSALELQQLSLSALL